MIKFSTIQNALQLDADFIPHHRISTNWYKKPPRTNQITVLWQSQTVNNSNILLTK
jgi:hypothetical protein